VVWSPLFESHVRPDGEREYRIGHELVDQFLEFVVGRARPNTVRCYAHDLSVFFTVVAKEPTEVTPKDVMAFVTAQRRPRPGAENVVRIDGGSGLSAATIKRRLAAVSSLYGYLITRDDVSVAVNPVPRGIATRQSRSRSGRGLPLVRGVRRLPRILEPDEIEALMAALRTDRDRAMVQAMVQAMVLGGLRRCEVLGLRLGDLRLGEWRVMITEGKGGHERLVPLSPTFFATVARYMNDERPPDTTTDSVFVSLKGPRRGQPLSTPGLDEIVRAARKRAGLSHGTCHELRHTCFTRLREAGMAIEAIQAQAGHRSISSTRVYLHLSVDWLADEYRRAVEAIEAQALVGVAQ
jgi:integrase/recombinase XerD